MFEFDVNYSMCRQTRRAVASWRLDYYSDWLTPQLMVVKRPSMHRPDWPEDATHNTQRYHLSLKMPISQDLSVEQLRNLLDDTQAALAAAFARIEGFRLREKSLMAELSTLRQQVHGGSSDGGPSAGLHLPEGSTDPAAQTPLHMVEEASVEWTSPSLSPVYVTNCEASYPVHIMSAGRKVSGVVLGSL